MSPEAPTDAARCAVHPEALAGGTCQRCGSFLCPACAHGLLGALFCAACAARPEVNYLETFRLKHWGRRDGWAYSVGAATVGMALGALQAFGRGESAVGLALLAAVPVGGAFFLGRPWARHALLVYPPAAALVLVPSRGVGALVLAAVLFLVTLNIYLDARSQLFFRRELPTPVLHRLWDFHANNPMARDALSLGLGALLLPLLAPLAVVFGIIGLRRVDPTAHPPIDRRWQALGGLVLGLASLALWVLLFWPALRSVLRLYTDS